MKNVAVVADRILSWKSETQVAIYKTGDSILSSNFDIFITQLDRECVGDGMSRKEKEEGCRGRTG